MFGDYSLAEGLLFVGLVVAALLIDLFAHK